MPLIDTPTCKAVWTKKILLRRYYESLGLRVHFAGAGAGPFLGAEHCNDRSLMDLDDAMLNEAFEVFSEFGPNLRVPREKRLANVFPSLSPDDVSALFQEMERVNKTIWSVAELGGQQKLGMQKTLELLKGQHPFLQAGGLSRAIFLTNYYAWHEGFAK